MKYKIFFTILMMWVILLIGWAIMSERESPATDISVTQITDKLELVETSTKQITEESTTEDINRYWLQSMGEFKITVYTPHSDDGAWGYQTSSGEQSKHLRTCAVDPDVLPIGSVIVVNGLTLTCVDTGGAVKGNVIDIFYDGTEAEALEWISEFGTSAEVRLQYWGDYSEEHAPIK